MIFIYQKNKNKRYVYEIYENGNEFSQVGKKFEEIIWAIDHWMINIKQYLN
jgi:hypothetical protein